MAELMKKLDYKVIASGSTGNAVRIENLMIDCGITYKKMEEELAKCDALFITHIHNDHFKSPTMRKIKKMFPNIKIFTNFDVQKQKNELIEEDSVLDYGECFKCGDLLVETFKGYHDVPTQGLKIKKGDLDILYLTDTYKIPGAIKNDKFDYFFLEANYDDQMIMELAESESKHSFDAYLNSTTRHLSKQSCRGYFYAHRKSNQSELIELHKSKRFY